MQTHVWPHGACRQGECEGPTFGVSDEHPLESVDVLAVGISPDIDEKELERITDNSENVFYADNFDELDSFQFVDQITGMVCPSK